MSAPRIALHSPTPWLDVPDLTPPVFERATIFECNGASILAVYPNFHDDEINQANVAFVRRAINTHDEHVTLLGEALTHLACDYLLDPNHIHTLEGCNTPPSLGRWLERARELLMNKPRPVR